MDAFYFGPPSRRLFGAYDGPLVRSEPPRGVVFCYPMGQEAVHAHRALRRLSQRVARAGQGALRFDYYGSGDSEGGSEDGDVQQWMNDVALAIDELKRRDGLATVSVVGLRLGAALATLVASQRSDVESLVLWEPVLRGSAYLEEMLSAHREWERRCKEAWGWDPETDAAAQVLGFPLSGTMRRTLERIDLLDLQRRPARKALIIERGENDAEGSLGKHLTALGTAVDQDPVSESGVWMPTGLNRTVVPHQLLERIVAWLAAVARD